MIDKEDIDKETTPYDPKLGYQMFLYSAIAYTNPEDNITPWKFYPPTDCNLLTEGMSDYITL